jgi:hypothetical protein
LKALCATGQRERQAELGGSCVHDVPSNSWDRGSFAPKRISIRTEPMLRTQGYSEPDRVLPQIKEVASDMRARAQTLLVPATFYRRVDIRRCDEYGLTLKTGATFRGGDLRDVLSGCTSVVVFILTIGEKLDLETQRLQSEEDLIEALFLETAGWLAVEHATQLFVTYLRRRAQIHGYRLTRRLAPGYDGWPLSDQSSLFSLFDGTPLPVRLLEGCCMVPKMSRSGLYGLRPQRTFTGSSGTDDRGRGSDGRAQ